MTRFLVFDDDSDASDASQRQSQTQTQRKSQSQSRPWSQSPPQPRARRWPPGVPSDHDDGDLQEMWDFNNMALNPIAAEVEDITPALLAFMQVRTRDDSPLTRAMARVDKYCSEVGDWNDETVHIVLAFLVEKPSNADLILGVSDASFGARVPQLARAAAALRRGLLS